MTCETCRHCRPHMQFRVCRHPKMLDWQRKLNGCDTGLHCDIAFGWCNGRNYEAAT